MIFPILLRVIFDASASDIHIALRNGRGGGVLGWHWAIPHLTLIWRAGEVCGQGKKERAFVVRRREACCGHIGSISLFRAASKKSKEVRGGKLGGGFFTNKYII
jgi:hypothetical protein